MNQLQREIAECVYDMRDKLTTDWSQIVSNMQNTCPLADHITAPFGKMCPSIQYISIDALKPSDYPNGIERNSIFITYKVDLLEHKVMIHSSGHVWLSPKDKATDRYKYLAMKSVLDIHEDKGGYKFRKQSYKSTQHLVEKLSKHFNEVMQSVVEYTGGYPYKEGIEE